METWVPDGELESDSEWPCWQQVSRAHDHLSAVLIENFPMSEMPRDALDGKQAVCARA